MINAVMPVKVWFRYKGNVDTERYVIGTYHPNLKTIYISEYQYHDILKKYCAKSGDVSPDNWRNLARTKIIWNDGHSNFWG